MAGVRMWKGPLGGPAASVFAVGDVSQVGEVRRAADSLAARVGLGENERGKLALVVTEAATNLSLHAKAGRILLSEVAEEDAAGVEVLAIDEGPGIANVTRAMEDGYSSAGTAGKGLGAMRRLADQFDLYSRAAGPGGGTAIVARIFAAGRGPGARAPLALEARAVCVPVAGERDCGDSWLIVEGRDRMLVAVVDGLGHGPEAALASSVAVRVIRERSDASPAVLVEAAHAALRSTRGAALAIAEVRPAQGTLAFAGVGNVSAAIHGRSGPRSLASHNGTVGHVMRKVQQFEYDWPEKATLVIHTDGINTHWRLDAYPGLALRDPSLLAATLFRDAARGRDDATVVVAREVGREDGRPGAVGAG